MAHPWDTKIARLAKAFKESSEPEQDDAMAKDTLVPGAGNKRSYQDFQPKGGVHVAINLNDMRALNSSFSYQHGDDAISNVGKVFTDASQANQGKLFRMGDEFRAHFPTPEQAYSFLRQAHDSVSSLVPVGGYHRVSFSAGLGLDPYGADQALHSAKGAKRARYGDTAGHGQHFAHSLLPGAAGEVPVAEEPLIPAGFKPKQTEPMPLPVIP